MVRSSRSTGGTPASPGGHGCHVVAPLDAETGFDEVRALARDLADRLAAEEPDRLTTEQRKPARGNRIFLDTTRNAYGQTAIAPYSLRSRRQAPVPTPIELDELARTTPDRYHLGNIRRRLAAKPDPWANIAASATAAPTCVPTRPPA
jgi:bifunctional non-homologous end joining protein LigD